MTWHLNEDISYCQLDGRLLFLDIQRDLYFQLSEALERNFLDYLETPEIADIDRLARYNLLSQSAKEAHECKAPDISPPRQSVPEAPSTDGRVPATVIRDVFIIVAKMRLQQKKRGLKSILQALSEYRRKRTCVAHTNEAEVQRRVAEAANAFNRVRP